MKRYLINFALKEAFDSLPAAVCCCTQTGTIRLCNRKMHALYRKMTGTDFQNVEELMSVLEHPECHAGFEREGNVIVFSDGEAWEFSKNQIVTEDRETYMEIRFTDVSELYEKQKRLKKQSEELKDMYSTLHELNEKRMRMSEEKEILEMKMRIHDSMNTGMTAIRQVLEGSADISDLEAVAQLRKSVRLLSVPVKQDFPQAMEEFIHDASIMGVEVRLTGSLPHDHEKFLIALFREACINAARHADATVLWIDIREEENIIQVTVHDNGNGSKDMPVMTGGLKDLSSVVKEKGGSLQITCTHPFTVMAQLQKQEEQPDDRSTDY